MKKLRGSSRVLSKMTAMLIALVMVVGTLPGLTLSAFAAPGDTGGEAAVDITNPNAVYEGITPGVKREADNITMNDYQSSLLNNEDNGSRFAGRVWADKTVVAHDDDSDGWNYITSNMTGSATPMPEGEPSTAEDPTYGEQNWTVGFKDDFLHVYSSLGSSQVVTEYPRNPIDLVIILDLSGSMATDVEDGDHKGNSKDHLPHSRITKVLNAMNSAIDKLMKDKDRVGNRVAVIGYGGTACTLLPLDHYEAVEFDDNGIGQYLTVSDLTDYGGDEYKGNRSDNESGAYTVTAKANDNTGKLYTKSVRNDYSSKTDNQYIGFNTNMQAGIYQAFNELYSHANKPEDVTYTHTLQSGKKRTIARIPAAFVMTDGGSNYALKKDDKDPDGTEWYELGDPLPNNLKSYNNSEVRKKYRTEGAYGGDVTILDILMMASFMKSKVQNKYTKLMEGTPAQQTGKVKFPIHTISVDTPDEKNYQTPRVYATLDPGKYFNSSGNPKWSSNKDVTDAFAKWQQWKSGGEPAESFTDPDNKTVNVKFKQLTDTEEKKYGVTNEDVANNIVYNDSFRDVGGKGLDAVFDELVAELGEAAFLPVDGENASGLTNSVTYEDPIGKHMEVKDRALKIERKDSHNKDELQQPASSDGVYDMGMYLFGNMLGVAKTAVYSYDLAKTYKDDLNKKEIELTIPDESGGVQKVKAHGAWFKLNPNAEDDSLAQKYVPCDTNETKSTTEDNWAAGYIFICDETMAKSFLPSEYPSTAYNDETDADGNRKFNDGDTHINPNIQFNLYRIEANDYSDPYNTMLRDNPSYGYTEKTIDGKEVQVPNQQFKLGVVRIWTEDSGDYDDPNAGITEDVGYDQKLYVNLPVAALPLQIANVDVQADGDVTSYTTNVEGNAENSNRYIQSTPFRVFYSVGMEDEAMSDDGLSIDLAKIDLDYIQKHKMPDNNVYFYSNYYSEQSYNGYLDAEENVTHGDPGLSFSPAENNRYYVMQQAVPLMKIFKKNGTVPDPVEEPRPAPIESGDIEKILSDYNAAHSDAQLKSWDYGAEDLKLETDQYTTKYITTISEMSNGNYDTAASIDDPEASSDPTGDKKQQEWSYLILNSYKKDPTGDNPNHGKIVHRAVARNSSDFGSGLTTESAALSDLLCWYNIKTGDTAEIVLGGGDEGGKPDETSPAEGHDLTTDAEYYKKENWVLATKPGSLRTGNMYEFVVEKGDGNNTESSDTVRVPMVREVTADGSVVINSYLGNEGRLATMDKMLAITKEVETDDYYKQYTSDKIFNYLVTIGGNTAGEEGGNEYSGLEGDYSAIVIKRHGVNDEKHWDYQLDGIKVNVDSEGYLTAVDDTGTTGRVVFTGMEDDYISKDGTNQSGQLTGKTFLVKVNDYNGGEEGKYALAQEYRTDDDAEQQFYLLNATIEYGTENPEDPENADGVITDTSAESTEWNPTGEPDTGHIKIWQTERSTDENGVISDFGDSNDPDLTARRCEITPMFRTHTVYFGYRNANMPDGSETKPWPEGWPYKDEKGDNARGPVVPDGRTTAWTAEVELKDGYGLLFNGIDDSVPYTMTEILDEDDLKAGFQFSQVKHIQSVRQSGTGETRSTITHKKDHTTGEITPGDDISEFVHDETGTDYTYEVKGRTDGNAVQAETAHFTNYYGPVSMVVDKVVKRPDGEEVKYDPAGEDTEEYKQKFKEDYGQTFNFTVKLKSNGGTMLPFLKDAAGNSTDEMRVNWFYDDPNVAQAFDDEVVKYGTLEATEVNENFTEATLSFTLRHGQHFGILGLPQGTEYTINEVRPTDASDPTSSSDPTASSEPAVKGYLTSWKGTESGDAEVPGTTASGTTTADAAYTYVTFMNQMSDEEVPEPDVRSLEIQKRVVSSDEVDRTFMFTVTLTPPDGVELANAYPYTGKGGLPSGVIKLSPVIDPATGEAKTDGSKQGTISLKDGESADINNLPVGTSYLVEEAPVDGYTQSVEQNSGTTGNNTSSVVYTNTLEKTDLNISKIVSGAGAPLDREYTFRVVLTPRHPETSLSSWYDYEITKMAKVDDAAELPNPAAGQLVFSPVADSADHSVYCDVTLKHGQQITIKGLPYGTKYKVEEINLDFDFSGKQLPDEAQTPEVKIYEPVQKTDEYGAPMFDESGAPIIENISTELVPVLDENGAVKLDSEGAQLTEEVTVDGTGELNGNKTVAFENAFSPVGWLGVSKTVEGSDADINKVWKFDVEITPPEGSTFEQLFTVNNDKFTANATSTIAKPQDNAVETDQNEVPDYDLTPVEFTIDKTTKDTIVAHATVELKHGQTIVIELPAGTTYTLMEYEANEDGYDSYSNVDLSPEIFNRQISWGHFRNVKGNPEETPNPNVTPAPSGTPGPDETPNPDETPEPGSTPTPGHNDHKLLLSKTVAGDTVEADKDKEWEFNITFTGSGLKDEYTYTGSALYDGVTPPDNGTLKLDRATGALTLPDGSKLTLKHGQMITIEGIESGTHYKIEETAVQKYYTSVVGSPNEATITTEDRNVAFVNQTNPDEGLGSLIVHKWVTGNAAEREPDKEFIFEIHFYTDDTCTTELEQKFPYTGSYTGEIGMGQNTVTLKNNEMINITGIPAGTVYTCKETNANQDGYTTKATDDKGTISNEKGTIVSKQVVSEEYVNNKNLDVGWLGVTKDVRNAKPGDENRKWKFEIEIAPPVGGNIDDYAEALANVPTKSDIAPEAGWQNWIDESIEKWKTEVTDTVGEWFTGDPISFTIDSTSNVAKAYVELEAGHSIVLQLPVGVRYTLKEFDANEGGYKSYSNVDLSPDINEGRITWGHFRNEYEGKETPGPDITPNPSGEPEGTPGPGESPNPSDEPGNSPGPGESPNPSGEPEGTPGPDATPTPVPTPAEYNLSVSKTVIGGAAGDASGDWTFDITLTAPDGAPLDGTCNIVYSSLYGEMIDFSAMPNSITFTEGRASITLKHGMMADIIGLPNGTKYEVVENNPDTSLWYSSDVGSPTQGTIDGEDRDIAFVNQTEPDENVGSLIIYKHVTGEAIEQEPDDVLFSFVVHFYQKPDDLTVGDYNIDELEKITDSYSCVIGGEQTTVKSGDTIKIANNQSAVISGLPEGTIYTITEPTNDKGYYFLYATDDKGTLSNGIGTVVSREVVSEEFVNTKDMPEPTPTPVITPEPTPTPIVEEPTPEPENVGWLGVTKDVKNAKPGDENRAWKFEIEIAPPVGGNIEDYAEALANVPTKRDIAPEDGWQNWINESVESWKTKVTDTVGERFDGDAVSFTIDKTSNVAKAYVELKAGESIVLQLPVGVSYTLKEFDANEGGYKSYSNVDLSPDINEGRITWGHFRNEYEPKETPGPDGTPGPGETPNPNESPDPNATPTPVPTPENYDLSISKSVVAGLAGNAGGDWTFDITLTAPDGAPLGGTYDIKYSSLYSDIDFTGMPENITFVNGKASITLKHGMMADIIGLPNGTKYEVVESNPDTDDNTWYSSDVGSPTQGTIDGEDRDIAFVNQTEPTENEGSLIIYKHVTGEAIEQEPEDVLFSFVVHFYQKPEDLTVGDYDVTRLTELDGSFTCTIGGAENAVRSGDTIKIANDQSAIISGLPEGTIYTITEPTNDKGYEFLYATDDKGTLSNGLGTVVSGEVVSEEFVNTKDLPEPTPTPVVTPEPTPTPVVEEPTPEPEHIGWLGVTKDVKSAKPGDENRAWEFEIEIAPPVGGRIEDYADALANVPTKSDIAPETGWQSWINESVESWKTKVTDTVGERFDGDAISFTIDSTSNVAKAHVELQAGHSIVLQLPIGVSYTLKEFDANEGGYKSYSNVDLSPDINEGRITWGHFRNEYEGKETPGPDITPGPDETPGPGESPNPGGEPEGTPGPDATPTPVPTPAEYNLSVSKTVIGGAAGDASGDWTFDITLTAPDGAPLDGTCNIVYSSLYGEMIDFSAMPNSITFTEGRASITLKHGMMADIIGLPNGTKYEVVENNPDTSLWYSSDVGSPTQGTIDGEDRDIAFVNQTEPDENVGSLIIYKHVTGEAIEQEPDDVLFSFVVHFYQKPDDLTVGDYNIDELEKITDSYSCVIGGEQTTVKSGDTIKIANNQSAVISGLPEGTIYTITEPTNDKGYYFLYATDDKGTLSNGIGTVVSREVVSEEFVNTKDMPEPTPVPTPVPTPIVTPEPTPVVTPEPTPEPTLVPTPLPTLVPTPEPTPTKTPPRVTPRPNIPYVPGTPWFGTDPTPTPISTAAPTPTAAVTPEPVPTAAPPNVPDTPVTPDTPATPEPEDIITEPTATPDSTGNKSTIGGGTDNPIFTTGPEQDPTPKTGDSSNMALWITLAVLCLAAAAVLLGMSTRKSQKNDKRRS